VGYEGELIPDNGKPNDLNIALKFNEAKMKVYIFIIIIYSSPSLH
jgi:hypothetical protein